MPPSFKSIRGRLDRAGIFLSGLCAVHCVLGVVLVGVLGLGGGVLLDPAIHEVGLALAVVFGAVSLGFGVRHHGRVAPLVIGGLGLSLMATALFVGHGLPEAVLTILGVALVASAHIVNLRGHRAHASDQHRP
ncbi:MerC domain-containing protein [Novosphingobium sp. 1949]|uniref:MerC domain-containing protein n=1 Tax=Novosphingobium organovorum TaxID=2930092 RepID=A0ABT0BB61_9SPHN|nr:MerC domain-containing protein [Novosphingobium organovorum]MCJ2182243.1 MerC domain-containing protein [Novosphingobium organovorum]